MPTRGIDMRGAVVGDLRVVRESHRDSRGIIWECTCLGCGDTVLRTGVSLRGAIDFGHASACAECRRQVRAAIAATRPRFWLRDMFARAGTLYGETWPTTSVPDASTVRPRRETCDFGGEPYRGGVEYGFAEIAQHDGYVCAQCQHVTTDAVGCLDCVEPICRPCAQEHDCTAPMTLSEVGAHFGVSVERIRQIEAGALRRLFDLVHRAALQHETRERVADMRREGFRVEASEA